jgi:hypothetical protein
MICSLLIISWSAAAAELTTLVFSNDEGNHSCELAELGKDRLDNPIIIKAQIYRENGCTVNIPIDEFNKKFQFCALGVNNGKYLTECGVSITRKGFMGPGPSADFFIAGFGDCRFVCLTK